MATATYDLIASQTLGSAAASITFSSIPSTYTDLRLVITSIATGASNYNLFYRFNGDTGSNYSRTILYGDGSSAASNASVNFSFGAIVFSIGINAIPSLCTMDIFSYAGSTYKTQLTTASVDTNGTGNVVRNVNLWRSTSAITSILFYTDASNNFATGTTAQLYGIKAA